MVGVGGLWCPRGVVPRGGAVGVEPRVRGWSWGRFVPTYRRTFGYTILAEATTTDSEVSAELRAPARVLEFTVASSSSVDPDHRVGLFVGNNNVAGTDPREYTPAGFGGQISDNSPGIPYVSETGEIWRVVLGQVIMVDPFRLVVVFDNQAGFASRVHGWVVVEFLRRV